jgi:AP-4 complex subunit epsilon-1
MHILRILAILGRGDQTVSEGMYEVLGDVMRKADTGINVGYAIGERERD